jgi:hypothetical protein
LADLDSPFGKPKIRHMLKRTTILKAVAYTVRCAFAAGLIMFVCMAAGELFVNPQLFRGFLTKPRIWPLIFLESATWIIPMALLSLPFLWGMRKLKGGTATSVVVGCWAVLGIVAIVTYKAIYDSGEWALDQITKADIMFGWTIPCTVILITNAVLSLQYLEVVRNKSSEQ